jgi:hypothetical protein
VDFEHVAADRARSSGIRLTYKLRLEDYGPRASVDSGFAGATQISEIGIGSREDDPEFGV